MALPSALQKESDLLEAELQEHFNGVKQEAVPEPAQMIQEPVAVVPPAPVTPPVQEPIHATPPEPESRHIEGLGEFAGNEHRPTDWEQKFKSMDGRLRKESESSHRFRDENDELRLEIERLKTEREEAKARKDVGHYLTPEQREEFDDEQIAMAASVAKGVVNPAVEDLRGEVQALKKILSESQSDHAAQLKQTFTTELLRYVPDWFELNDARNMGTLGFREWLHEVDPSTGYLRIDIMNHLCRGREAERVGQWVNKYKESHGYSVTPANVAPQASLVEPKGSTGSAVATEPGKTTYTVKDAKVRYEEIAKRLTSGRVGKDERINLEKELDDLDRAFAEGRVFDPSTRIV